MAYSTDIDPRKLSPISTQAIEEGASPPVSTKSSERGAEIEPAPPARTTNFDHHRTERSPNMNERQVQLGNAKDDLLSESMDITNRKVRVGNGEKPRETRWQKFRTAVKKFFEQIFEKSLWVRVGTTRTGTARARRNWARQAEELKVMVEDRVTKYFPYLDELSDDDQRKFTRLVDKIDRIVDKYVDANKESTDNNSVAVGRIDPNQEIDKGRISIGLIDSMFSLPPHLIVANSKKAVPKRTTFDPLGLGRQETLGDDAQELHRLTASRMKHKAGFFALQKNDQKKYNRIIREINTILGEHVDGSHLDRLERAAGREHLAWLDRKLGIEGEGEGGIIKFQKDYAERDRWELNQIAIKTSLSLSQNEEI